MCVCVCVRVFVRAWRLRSYLYGFIEDADAAREDAQRKTVRHAMRAALFLHRPESPSAPEESHGESFNHHNPGSAAASLSRAHSVSRKEREDRQFFAKLRRASVVMQKHVRRKQSRGKLPEPDTGGSRSAAPQILDGDATDGGATFIRAARAIGTQRRRTTT